MSVEKMEQYKEYKKNRKEILRKQKRKEKINAIIGVICAVVIVGAIGFGIYSDVKPKNEKKYVSLVDWNKYLPTPEAEAAEDEADAQTEAAGAEGTESEDSANQE